MRLGITSYILITSIIKLQGIVEIVVRRLLKQSVGFKLALPPLSLRSRVQDLGFRIPDLGRVVLNLGFRFRV